MAATWSGVTRYPDRDPFDERNTPRTTRRRELADWFERTGHRTLSAAVKTGGKLCGRCREAPEPPPGLVKACDNRTPVSYWWVVDAVPCDGSHQCEAPQHVHGCYRSTFADEGNGITCSAPPADLVALPEPCPTCDGTGSIEGRNIASHDVCFDDWKLHGGNCHNGARLVEARQTCHGNTPGKPIWHCTACGGYPHPGTVLRGVGTLDIGEAIATFIGAAIPNPPHSTRTDIVVPVIDGYFAWQSPWEDLDLSPGQFVARWTEVQP